MTMECRLGLGVFVSVSLHAGIAQAQASYRNLDAGFPVRVEDATVTERYALDLDFLNLRYDALSDSRNRFLYEPQVSYGMLPRTEVWVRLPSYYRERTVTPRSGIAGFGVGAMYQFTVETLHVPALALATELFQPVGRDALPSSYSLRTVAEVYELVRARLFQSAASRESLSGVARAMLSVSDVALERGVLSPSTMSPSTSDCETNSGSIDADV